MKIIIPVDEASPNTGVCVSFGRAPYFALCEGEGVTFIENPGAAAEGGAGLKIYKSKDGTALENAAALEAGGLEELTHFHAGFHGIA